MAATSSAETAWPYVWPGGIVPGHATTNGVCIPPSVSMPFSPFSGVFSDPSQPGPPPGASSLWIFSGAPLSPM